MPTFKFLCLHGAGTNAEILRAQLRPIIQNLERDGIATFHFIDGELESLIPGPGIEGVYDSPYLCYYNWPRSFNTEDDKTVTDAYDLLYEVIEEEGPFDGILGFSHGAALAYGFLAQHAKENRYDGSGSLFRCGIFLGSMPPFRRTDDKQIIYDEGLQNSVKIPTLHVAGKNDFVYEHSIALHGMCNKQWAKLTVHNKGHEIPGDAKNVVAIAAGIRELIREASFR